MKKNILIISIYYPPKQSIASNRIYSFAKYLDKNKFNIFVHTIDENVNYQNDLDGVNITRVKNSSVLKPFTFEKRQGKLLHYSKVIYNILLQKFTKNIYQKWIDDSYRLLKQKIKEENIELIISSFAPDASHILALKLKKEFPNLRWIADMRDEMSQSPYIDKKTKNQYSILEQEIFTYADAITSVSKPILDEFKMLNKNKELIFREIRNGYDFDLDNKNYKNEVFTISYIGNFYGDIKPDNFLQALSNIKDKINIKVQFIGVKTYFEIPKNIKNIITIIPPVSHKKAIEYMKKSDILLLIYPNNNRKGVYTGKLFEYLGALKPILALINENDVASKLIKKANAGIVCDNSNIKEIEESILKFYNKWLNDVKRDYNIEVIKQHHRKEQTKRLQKLIEEILNAR